VPDWHPRSLETDPAVAQLARNEDENSKLAAEDVVAGTVFRAGNARGHGQRCFLQPKRCITASNGVDLFWAFAPSGGGSENMKDSTPYRSVLLRSAWGILSAAALASAPPQTFAQHTGGGGHFGGGGGHASGGAGHESATHVSAPAAPVARSVSPPTGAIGNHSVLVAPSSSMTPPPSAHFGAAVLGNHVVMPPAVPERSTIGFPQVTGGPRQILPASGSLRFYGQGSHIWQAPPVSTAHIARPGTSTSASTGRGQYTVREARPSVMPSPSLPRIFPRPVRPIRGPIYGGFGIFGVGVPFFGFGEFGLGWRLGFGWGPSCGPYWGWGFGCNALPYYDYGYSYNGYSGPPPPNGLQAEPAMPSQENGPFSYEYPPPDTSPDNVSAEKFETVLYLKDGTVYAVINYWLADGKLVYQTNYGGENSIDLDQIEMQKTVDVNASRGVNFTLRPKPLGNDQNPAATPGPAPQLEQPSAPPSGGQSSPPGTPTPSPQPQ
jgi:hypothetical protein